MCPSSHAGGGDTWDWSARCHLQFLVLEDAGFPVDVVDTWGCSPAARCPCGPGVPQQAQRFFKLPLGGKNPEEDSGGSEEGLPQALVFCGYVRSSSIFLCSLQVLAVNQGSAHSLFS